MFLFARCILDSKVSKVGDSDTRGWKLRDTDPNSYHTLPRPFFPSSVPVLHMDEGPFLYLTWILKLHRSEGPDPGPGIGESLPPTDTLSPMWEKYTSLRLALDSIKGETKKFVCGGRSLKSLNEIQTKNGRSREQSWLITIKVHRHPIKSTEVFFQCSGSCSRSHGSRN